MDLFSHISFSDWCKHLSVSEGCSRAAWFKEAECFLSPASKVSSPLSAVLKKVPRPSEADSDRKEQEAGSPDPGRPHYLVALGIVLDPKLRHARVCTHGQRRVCIAKQRNGPHGH